MRIFSEDELYDSCILSKETLKLLSSKAGDISLPYFEFRSDIKNLIETNTKEDLLKAEEIINTQLNNYFQATIPTEQDSTLIKATMRSSFTVFETIKLLSTLLEKDPEEIAYNLDIQNRENIYRTLYSEHILADKINTLFKTCSNQDILTALAK